MLFRFYLFIYLFVCLFIFCLMCFFRATPAAYGGSQARGQIRAAYGGSQARGQIRAAGLHHSHNNTRSVSCVCDLHHSSRRRRILIPLSEARDRTRNLLVPSQIFFCCTTTGPPRFYLNAVEWKATNFLKNRGVRAVF